MKKENMVTERLTALWNKGELTTPKYIQALQKHAEQLEIQIDETNCANCIHRIKDSLGKMKCDNDESFLYGSEVVSDISCGEFK